MSKKRKSLLSIKKEYLSVTRKRKSLCVRSDRQLIKAELLTISKIHNNTRKY